MVLVIQSGSQIKTKIWFIWLSKVNAQQQQSLDHLSTGSDTKTSRFAFFGIVRPFTTEVEFKNSSALLRRHRGVDRRRCSYHGRVPGGAFFRLESWNVCRLGKRSRGRPVRPAPSAACSEQLLFIKEKLCQMFLSRNTLCWFALPLPGHDGRRLFTYAFAEFETDKKDFQAVKAEIILRWPLATGTNFQLIRDRERWIKRGD